MATTTEIEKLINRLTLDGDERQELWVHYLENNDVLTLSNHLAKIRIAFAEDDLLQIAIWKRINLYPGPQFACLLSFFSDLEQSVIRLLALGASLAEISNIRGIKSVRVRHVISVIREHEIWL